MIISKRKDDIHYKGFNHEKIAKYLENKKLYIPVRNGDEIEDDCQFIEDCQQQD